MPSRRGTTFQKRQREAKRLEKQRMKAEKRAARRQAKAGDTALAGAIQPPVPAPG